MRDTDRGRDISRGRSRLPAGSPMEDSILGSQPELKAYAQPLRHLGVPACFVFIFSEVMLKFRFNCPGNSINAVIERRQHPNAGSVPKQVRATDKVIHSFFWHFKFAFLQNDTIYPGVFSKKSFIYKVLLIWLKNVACTIQFSIKYIVNKICFQCSYFTLLLFFSYFTLNLHKNRQFY